MMMVLVSLSSSVMFLSLIVILSYFSYLGLQLIPIYQVIYQWPGYNLISGYSLIFYDLELNIIFGARFISKIFLAVEPTVKASFIGLMN